VSAAERAAAGTMASTFGPAAALQAGLFVACSWLLAAVAIGAAQLAHQGLHEHPELPPLVHWLRDTAVAVPLAALSIGLAAIVVRWLAGRVGDGQGRSLAAWLAWASLAAFLFAVLSVPGNQLHGLLFGAEEEEGVGWLEDAFTDGGIVLGASLVTLVPAAVIGRWLLGTSPATSAATAAPAATQADAAAPRGTHSPTTAASALRAPGGPATPGVMADSVLAGGDR
jgi:hypothetical protein